MELKPVDYTNLSEDVVEEPLNQMEDDEEEEHAPSWEDEFGDELVGLPIYEEDGEFDPVGDLIYLETLIMGKPAMEIKRAPNGKEEEVANEEDQNTMVVESPHHMKFSRSVKELDSGSPPNFKKPKKRARKCLDQHVLRVQRWYIKSYRTKLKCKIDHFPHYMPRIRLLFQGCYWLIDDTWLDSSVGMPLPLVYGLLISFVRDDFIDTCFCSISRWRAWDTTREPI
ncbi:uncharacterized protein LOC143568802 [Bidens hawaiensis]|uniref:uncharacterized protein LOC143568802 n=1 Tax=Bidens hawaiensis TaxID=980011 RepID=UPI004049D53C